MNPCPCGWAGDASGRCRCGEDAVHRYRSRISGPLLDRIDLHVNLQRLPPAALRASAPDGEPSAVVRARVDAARRRQLARAGRINAQLLPADALSTCRLEPGDEALLEHAVDRLHLSARATVRLLRVARTIADLDGAESIGTAHLTEALTYRPAVAARAVAA